MKRKLLFAIIIAILLTPWPVAYAYDGDMTPSTPLTVTQASEEAQPNLNIFGNAIGTVMEGDLFYIDSSESGIDSMFTLFITNADELVSQYRYMTLSVGIYALNAGGEWEEITSYGDRCSELVLTMLNGCVEFCLEGYTNYKVTLDGGCFYSYSVKPGTSPVMPCFYIAATSATNTL